MAELAARHDRAPATIRVILDRNSVPRRDDRRSGRTASPSAAVDERAVVAEYTAGSTAREIAARHGCTAQTVRAIAARHGIELRDDRRAGHRLRSGSPRHAAVDEIAVVAEYRAGSTAPEIAARHDCTPKRIRTIVTRSGIQLRDDRATKSGSKPTPLQPELVDRVRQLYGAPGLTQAVTAQQLGISVRMVARIVRGTPDIEPHLSASARSMAGVGRAIKIPHHEHPAIVARYQAGESGSEIAATYECTATSIYYILHRSGVTIEPRRSTPVTGTDHARELRERITALGVTSDDIRRWAEVSGLAEYVGQRGIPSRHLVEAFEASRRTRIGDSRATSSGGGRSPGAIGR